MNPVISVIIPTYNRAHLVKDAIDSVLSQTYRDFEIIVVDDGSTDNTKEVLAPYRDKVKYIYQENQGLSAARNTGIRGARGEYIGFLDSDDLWLPPKLEKQVQILKEYKDIAFVYTNFIFIDETGKFIKVGCKAKSLVSGYILGNLLLSKTVTSPVTWLVRKTCFEDVGLFDIRFKRSEERDMEIRIAKNFKMYGIKEPLVKVRQIKSVETLGRCSAKDREYYRFKFLDKLFNDSNGEPIIEKNKRRLIAHYYFISGLAYLKEVDLTVARNRFCFSILKNPFRLNVYMYLFSTLIGNKGFRVLNGVRKLVLGVSNYYRRFKYNRLSTENGGK